MTFKVILKEEIPLGANVLPDFFLAVKSRIDRKTNNKASCVTAGHKDNMKDLMAHSWAMYALATYASDSFQLGCLDRGY